MTVEEILLTSTSKSEALRKLGYNTDKLSGSSIVSKLKQIANDNNIDESVVDSLNGIKYRSLKATEFYNKNCSCKYCGETLDIKDVLKKRKSFCNSSCAAKFNNKNRHLTDETKDKISKSLKLTHDSEEHIKTRTCVICGNDFLVNRTPNGRFSNSSTCSKECHKKLVSNNGKETYKKLVNECRFKCWKVRNIESYPEKFWKKVLENNGISYSFNHYICEFGYFLDFAIYLDDYKIDLEIDGKQHKYKDRVEHDIIRDNNVKSIGYIVYRVDWNSINSDNGKEEMNKKINEFLDFYNTLNDKVKIHTAII